MNTAVRVWHRLIGKDDKFYDLLRAGAREARTSVGLLTQYLTALRDGGSASDFTAFSESRRRQKATRAETLEELYKTLVPPFDRDDIQALAYALYRIPKSVEKLVERISIYPGQPPHDAFLRQADLLTKAAEALVQMVELLLARAPADEIARANDDLQNAEGDADKMMLSMLENLYAGGYSAKETIILQSLYERAERAVDRCRNAGTIVMQIALKNA
jgi:uncharacterized protein Yka (UPF0111/DUF47 family)